jgi:hypothetical protein
MSHGPILNFVTLPKGNQSCSWFALGDSASLNTNAVNS